jgi:drug/metabolite transporter (DMT)-like permease
MGALVISTIPLWVTIIGAVFLHRRVLFPTLLGIVCGFVGLLPIVLPHVTGSSDLAAFGVLLFAAISWSVGTAFGARLRVHDDALRATSMQLLSGSMLLVLAALVSREPSRIVWSSITPSTLWGMAYLIVFGSIAGYTAYVWLLKNAPPHIAAAFAYLAPIVTLFFGYVLHEETVTAATMAGALVILIGVGLVVGTRSSTPAQPSGHAVIEKSPPAGAQRAARQTHAVRPQPIGLGRKVCTDSQMGSG